MSLYPLKFKPRYLEKMWGGRKIETVLGKKLPAGRSIGESWELYDFPPGVVDESAHWFSSEVQSGSLAGRTLHELVGEFGRDLHGSAALVAPHGQFPILIKFLDANQDLSVQVHPDEAYASANPGAHLKNEAWYILQADPAARILKGLRAGVTRQAFKDAIVGGTVESSITAIPVRVGQCFYLPSGTVHALGAGILAAEVQTPSDTTYRVFDFNRIDPATGKRRGLHVEQALNCIDFSGKTPAPGPSTGPRLAQCEYFSIEKISLAAGQQKPVASGEPIVWMVLEGSVEVGGTQAGRGDTLLIPAALKDGHVKAQADSQWLEVTFPEKLR